MPPGPGSGGTLGHAGEYACSSPGVDMAIACEVIDAFEVPAGRDPQDFKEQLISEFLRRVLARRADDFIEGMSRWLSEATLA